MFSPLRRASLLLVLAGGPEGSCGRSMLGATEPYCKGRAFRWESARQRGLRLWKEKVIPYYFSAAPDSRARAYYWLGRVEAPGRPDEPVPGDVDALFTRLAERTLEVHDAVRSAACARSPFVAGCDKGRASPSLGLQSRLRIRNIKLVNDIMNGRQSAVSRPEIVSERGLAREQLLTIKPLTAAYTARLLQLFEEQTGLTPRDLPAPGVPEAPFDGRAVVFY